MPYIVTLKYNWFGSDWSTDYGTCLIEARFSSSSLIGSKFALLFAKISIAIILSIILTLKLLSSILWGSLSHIVIVVVIIDLYLAQSRVLFSKLLNDQGIGSFLIKHTIQFTHHLLLVLLWSMLLTHNWKPFLNLLTSMHKLFNLMIKEGCLFSLPSANEWLLCWFSFTLLLLLIWIHNVRLE